MSVKLEEALEISLQRLHAGDSPELAVSSFGEQAAELKPLVTTAKAVADLAAEVSVPVTAQNRSRAQFLSAAAVTVPAPRRRGLTFFHFRLAASSLILALCLVVGLLGTGLASAAALPGDVFYPVKRMVENIQINLAPDPPARLVLEENLDDRRLEEAARLSQISRREYVTFSGTLRQTADDRWMVGDLVINLPSTTPATQMAGQYVRVSGYSDTHQVDVEEIQLRSFTWDGVIQKMDTDSWVVGGIEVTLDANSSLAGVDAQLGATVHITAVRLSDNGYLVLTAVVQPVLTKMQLTATNEPSKAPTLKATKVDTEEGKKTEVPAPTRTATRQATKAPTEGARHSATPAPTKNETGTRTSGSTRVPSPTIVPSTTHDSGNDHH